MNMFRQFSLILLALLISSCGERAQAWIVLSFEMQDGQPAQMAFNNPRVPDMTEEECKGALSNAVGSLIQAAIQKEPRLSKAKFKDASCVMSAVDPIKPKGR